ncbi:SGS-domain-containing protein [Xylaria bambusicola]|uniref:SGS-domain-containing protein n=1 Tax=Xylaria bambusicola TaxID=326684 RepID=UPI002007A011|nr:SGS-domain-containing protein [Xylaria bambusicola]KAI0508929.1 SGS-domain-containing protein [Xylaria bambusicola]
MTSATLADAGIRQIKDHAYNEGIEKLTDAIKQRDAPLWYAERSKAYLRTNQYDAALRDAETALHIAYERGNRELMTEAQLRRAIAFYRMKKYADADVCALWALRLAEGAKAREDDDQRNKVDENGNYLVTAAQMKAAEAEKADRSKETEKRAALDPMTSKRKMELSQRNLALTWRLQSLNGMEKLPVGDDGRKVHVTDMYPGPSKNKTTDNTTENTAAGGDTAAWKQAWSLYQTQYKKHKIRYSYYQSDMALNVDIFVKNLSSGQVAIESDSHTVKISPAAQGVSIGAFGGPIVLLLSDEINPQATKYTVKSMKIELGLQKKRPGKWPSLLRQDAGIVDNLTVNDFSSGPSFDTFHIFVTSLGFDNFAKLQLPDYASSPSTWYVALIEKLRSVFNDQTRPASEPKMEAAVPSGSALPSSNAKPMSDPVIGTKESSGGGPAYPTSSKKGPQNWDKMDVDDDEDVSKDGDVNNFFQKIYKDADEDTKRAMMKSFIESNGTALSTSWDDAKSKTYKTQPPDGAEAKKWE